MNDYSQWYIHIGKEASLRKDADTGKFYLYSSGDPWCEMPATQSDGERLLKLLGVLHG